MTRLIHTDGALQLHFPRWEALMAGRREFTAPRAAILDATAATGWSSEVLGIRSGLVISGHRKLGVFTHPSGIRRLVSMKRGLPLLRVRLDRDLTGFDELLVSTPDAAAVVDSIHATVAP